MRGRHRHYNGGRGYNAPNSSYSYRGFNRSSNGSFTHKSYLSPRQKDEIFMEAGRLAAEYLVYKGLLPPHSLRPKSSTKGKFQDYKGQVRDSDGARGWQRGSDDCDDDRRGKKRTESDWEREDGRWTKRSRGYSDMEEEDGFDPGYKRERRSRIDGLSSRRSEVKGESGLGNHGIADDTGPNASSLSTKEELALKAVVDNFKALNSETGGEVMSDASGDSKRGNGEKEEEADGGPSETEGENKYGDELIKLCVFARVPTRPRSSMTLVTQKCTKMEEAIITVASKEIKPSSGEPKVIEEEDAVMGSSNNSLTNQTEIENKGPDESVNRHQEASQTPCLEFSHSIVVEAENLGAKQLNTDIERSPMDEEMVVPIEGDGEKPVGNAFIPKIEPELDTKLEEEKQLLPTSFKIRDLNLMEAFEVTMVPNDPIPDHLQTYASSLEPGKDVSLEFGLSIGDNNNSVAEDYSSISCDDKVVEVIDLEDDSVDDNSCEPSNPKVGPVLSKFG